MSRATREHAPRPTRDPLFELREVTDPEGITLQLFVEEESLFSARIRNIDLTEMFRTLRLAREDVVAQLAHELIARFDQERGRVNLTSPVLVSSTTADRHADRWVSRYVIPAVAGVEVGVAWYDPRSRAVGPDHVPVLVRSRMRESVQHKLAETRPGMLRVVLGVLDDLSS
jgi:hypothetical protein